MNRYVKLDDPARIAVPPAPSPGERRSRAVGVPDGLRDRGSVGSLIDNLIAEACNKNMMELIENKRSRHILIDTFCRFVSPVRSSDRELSAPCLDAHCPSYYSDKLTLA